MNPNFTVRSGGLTPAYHGTNACMDTKRGWSSKDQPVPMGTNGTGFRHFQVLLSRTVDSVFRTVRAADSVFRTWPHVAISRKKAQGSFCLPFPWTPFLSAILMHAEWWNRWRSWRQPRSEDGQHEGAPKTIPWEKGCGSAPGGSGTEGESRGLGSLQSCAVCTHLSSAWWVTLGPMA